MPYRVVRDEQVLDLKIPSLQFTFRDWLLCFGMYIVIGLAFLVIGIAPYFYRASSAVALPLCFMVLLVFVWFQTTFDFMTDGILPKEIRIFALALDTQRGNSFGIVAEKYQSRLVSAPFPTRCHLRNRRVSWSAQYRNFFSPWLGSGFPFIAALIFLSVSALWLFC